MTLVVDSSVVLAALLSEGADGAWAESLLASEVLVAPHQLHAEVAGVLRRRTLAGEITDVTGSAAHAALLAMSFDLYSYEAYAPRIWQLRHTVTIKDAWYVAIAESLGVSLATLDLRLTRAPGPRCEFLTPPP